MSEQVMNAEQLAEYLGIAESTVYKWVEYRKIPFTKIGTLLRFPKWIIDRWLAERAVRPEQSLFEEFERLHQRYHLERFLKAKGLDYERLTDEQLLEELRQAIVELKADEDED
jgi:excisionase family DNA binding protein